MKNYIASLAALFLFTSSSIAQTKVTFTVTEVPLGDLEKVGIRGNLAPLDWGKSIPLSAADGGYSITVEFPASADELEFKFVRYSDDKNPTWETTQNRTLTLSSGNVLTSNNSWNREQRIDVSKLEPIPSEGLLDDFELIKTMVLDIHPGTYRYNTQQEIAECLDQLRDKFSQPLSHGEAYLAISKVTAQLKCDHTKAGFNNQNKIINSVIHYQKDKVPFAFRWIDEQMIVTHNASSSELIERGTAILSINGIAVEEIKNQMLPCIGADGATDGNRSYKTEINGYDFRYNAFDIFFPLLFPFDQNTLSLEIQNYGSKERLEVQVETLTREERAKTFANRYPDFPTSRDDLWRFEVLQDSIGVLTVNSFGLFGWKAMTLDYKQFLKETFAQLNTNDIKHLIIDMRENTGGSDEMAVELFGYLTDEVYDFEREGRTRYLEFPESVKPYVQTWGDNPWYYNLKPKEKTPSDGYFIFPENFDRRKARDKGKKIFKGKTYLLIGSANTSLAFYTAYQFHKQQLGLTIGQETGGNLNDINGGQILFLRLPNSQIEIDFPVMGGFSLEPQPNRGVRPDMEVVVERKDIIENRDVGMEAALEVIKNSRK